MYGQYLGTDGMRNSNWYKPSINRNSKHGDYHN